VQDCLTTFREVAPLSIRLMQAWSYAMVPSVSTPPPNTSTRVVCLRAEQAGMMLPIDTRVAMPHTSYQLLELIHSLSKVYRILNSLVHRSLVKGSPFSSLQDEWTNEPLGYISGVQKGLGVLA
jgi:hypothetical protein